MYVYIYIYIYIYHAHNRLATKNKYKDMEEATFEKTLRLKTADPKEYRMSNQLRPFQVEYMCMLLYVCSQNILKHT